MDPQKKKALKNAYKSKAAVGGVYCIVCSGNQRRWIKSSVDIAGIQSRFEFALSIKSCPDPAMYSEWAEYGTESFSLVVLEEITMKESQTQREFADDVELLREMWTEKYAQGELE